MAIQKAELSKSFTFNPWWYADPPPWVLDYLDKEQIIQAAQIQLEFQRAVQAAYGKALQQFEGVLKSSGRGD
jgi:hypothetical protein